MMLSPKQFDGPIKIHFASPTGSELASVFVDRIVSQSGAIRFYFGKKCVAILSDRCLMIGPRQVDRGALREKKPYWYDPFETVLMLPSGHPLKAVLKVIA